MKISCLLLISLILLSSCSSTLMYNATPSDSNYIYRNGRQISFFEDDSLLIFLNYEESYGENLRFYLEVKNKSNQIVRTDPKLSYIDWMKSDTTLVSRSFVSDPENLINNIKQHSDEAVSNATVAAIFIGLLAITAVAVASAAASDDDDSDERCDSPPPVVYDFSELSEQKEEAERQIDKRLNDLKNDYFRITDIYPNESHGGYLEAKSYPYYDRITVNVSVGERIIPFKYNLSSYSK